LTGGCHAIWRVFNRMVENTVNQWVEYAIA